MQDLELAWETFEFHVASIINIELKLTSYIDKLNQSLDKDESILTQEGRKQLKIQRYDIINNIIKCSNFAINDYIKQNASLDDIIKIHKYFSLHGVPVPVEREVPMQYLFELKNENETLLEEIKVQREKFKTLLH
tara:strand:+ start:669 stop:1073 length:405 start_codon:yes stop_codon:yes gene_type:complete